MKKYLALASTLALAALLPACDDDNSNDDGLYVSDFTTINKVSYIPGSQLLANKTGLNAFLLSDEEGKTDIACYMYADTSEIVAPLTPSESWFENFYGGFCPTAFSADDDSWDPYRPITGSYHSGSGALVCNPGTACRALYMRRHFGADLSTLTSNLFLGDMERLYVCPTAQYKKLTTSDGLEELGITSFPSNIQIRLVVYAYVKSLNVSSLSAIKDLFSTNLKESDVKSSSYAILAQSDDEGDWTVNDYWQEIDLDDVDDYYVFECKLQVTNANGKVVSSFTLDDDNVDGSNKLNYCIIDDITVEDKSLF